MKTLFEKEKSKNPEGTIILDGGDLIQGSAVAALSKGAAFGPIIKAMEYDFLIPGNWEVVYGKEQMMRVLESFETPIISGNMYHESTGKHIYAPYIIKEIKGVKLGFIAYNDPEIPIRQNPSFSKGIRFDPVQENLSKLIKELKEEKKVDILFLVTHIGISKQYDLANQPYLEQVDYILGNDTHERIRKPIKGKYTKITEPGAFASFVGKLSLKVKNGTIIEENYNLIEVEPKIYPSNAIVASKIEAAVAPYTSITEDIIGYTSTPLYRYFVVENPMDNFITDALRWKTGTDIAISNGFRFSPPINVEKNGKAAITKGHLWNMVPVNENVKIGKASGKQIKNWLENEIHNVFAKNPTERFGGWLLRFSGMELLFYSNKEKGQRIAEIKINHIPLDEKKLYTIAACRREGEPMHMLCRMPHAIDTKIMDYTIHDVLEDYLKEKGTIAPVNDGRAQELSIYLLMYFLSYQELIIIFINIHFR